MAIKIQDNIPLPTGRSTGSRESGDITKAIRLLQPGQSFFVPATDCTARALQNRITGRSVQMRQSGQITFFIVTQQTEENVSLDDTVRMVPGVRVWRRPEVDLDDYEDAEHME